MNYLSLASGLDDAFAASPLVVLALSGIVCLLVVAFAKKKAAAAFAVCAMGLVLAIAASVLFSLPMMPRRVAGLLSMDGLSLIGTAIVLVSSLAVALASWPGLRAQKEESGAYYALLLFAALGALVLAATTNLATLFLGLELLSVSLYALVAYRRESEGTKAAFTYLILASVASAFLLFGMALAYYQTGSLELTGLLQAAADGSGGAVLTAAFAMMGVGFAFKLAVAPFHMWALEVYEGSSAPVAALIATVSKAAMAIPLIRALAPAAALSAAGAGPSYLPWAIAALSGASMLAGNLLALRETKIKRMLAGSSIAQLGYVLVALTAGGAYGASAALFYLAAYCLSSLGAFACVAALSPGRRPDRTVGPDDAEGAGDARREDFAGLSARRPLVAAVMTASLLSLAGMPLTAGFIGKFMLFASGLGAGGLLAGARAGTATRVLAILLAVNSALSLFYYLRLVSTMYRRGGDATGGAAAHPGIEAPLPFLAGSALAVIGLGIVILGTAPGPVLSLIASIAQR